MRVLKFIGKKWTIEIIEILVEFGKANFTQLKENIENISNRVLSERLNELEKLGLIVRKVHQDRSVEYTLSSKGLQLTKFLENIKKL
jgi:DNA-binding HxlR family transcriptional regulator